LISDFRRDLNIVYFLLGISPASNCSWRTTIWRRGNTQKKIYSKTLFYYRTGGLDVPGFECRWGERIFLSSKGVESRSRWSRGL